MRRQTDLSRTEDRERAATNRFSRAHSCHISPVTRTLLLKNFAGAKCRGLLRIRGVRHFLNQSLHAMAFLLQVNRRVS
jgi:hypothetical protein